jgi:hypothetical protein
MTISIGYNEMHDWTLKSIFYVWKTARVELSFESTESTQTMLVGEEVEELQVPQKRNWGPSVSVNRIYGPTDTGLVREMAIEMQSGDVIKIRARSFSTR